LDVSFGFCSATSLALFYYERLVLHKNYKRLLRSRINFVVATKKNIYMTVVMRHFGKK